MKGTIPLKASGYWVLSLCFSTLEEIKQAAHHLTLTVTLTTNVLRCTWQHHMQRVGHWTHDQEVVSLTPSRTWTGECLWTNDLSRFTTIHQGQLSLPTLRVR